VLAEPRDPAQPAVVLVRLRASGPHAVTACAEARQRSGQGLAAATRDASDSLDRLQAELGVRAVRAVFRRADGRPFSAQRAALYARAQHRRAALPPGTRAALPAVPELAHVYRVELAPGADAAAAAARYAADPHVVWAQPSADASLDLAADDPFLASSGSWGQPFPDLWGILRVGAPAAWDLSQGEGVIIAVVDTGIDTAHPDLAANLWVNPGEDLDRNARADPEDRNGQDDDGNGFIDDLNGFDFANSVDVDGDGDFDDPGDVSDADPFDDYGHGTHVAGTVAAVANNGVGVAGVAPRARLMALKGFKASGSTPDEVLARAMVYAAHNGARVINNSWSCSTRCPSNPVIEDAQALAASLGVVVVTSAGNRSDDVVFYSPKPRRDNIVVGASDEGDQPAVFTNTGFLVSVVAPGGGGLFGSGFLPQRAILSARSTGANLEADGGGVFVVGGDYLRWAGTSMSAPHVTGIAALVLAIHPEFTPDEVRAVIRSAARDVGAPGHDRLTGAGVADAARAVQTGAPSSGGVFTSPAPGAVVVPDAETMVIRGRVFGEVASAELAAGFGRNPTQFERIPLASPPADDELARWDAAALEDGPYVLRLEVRSADGSGAVEFLPVSLERNPPIRLSSPGAAARSPAISGERVVWESERPLDGEPLGLELFARDWSTGAEWRAVTGPGDQRSASLSGARLAWLDARDHPSDVRSCRLDGSQRPCREQTASAGPESRAGLVVSGETLVWYESVDGIQRLRGCTWRGDAGCLALAFPASDGRQLDPILRGTRLWWRDDGPSESTLFTCLGFPRRCDPVAIDPQGGPFAMAGSRSRLAWTFPAGGHLVFVCRAAGDGACPARLLGRFTGNEVQLAVSRHRVVWSAPGPGRDSDVFFCEDDPHTGECPIQRLTGSAADQRNPDISGTRVVWEDDRDGDVAIVGLELPSLDPIADRSGRVGRPLRIAVRGRDPSGGALALDAAFADGTPLAARGAAFRDRGDGSGVLTWTPRPGDTGPHVVTFAGRTAGHLTTRRSARIEVASQLASTSVTRQP